VSMVTGGELVIRTLLQAGVTDIFTLYGGHLETVFQSIREHGVRILDVRDEAAAGHAAEGYARATRNFAVALITAGPGFTNVVTSIANSYLDRTPVVYISASAALGHAETNMVQGGIDQVAIAKPITKWAHSVTATRDIPRLLAHAIRIANTIPTGPVLLDIPIDVSYGTVEESAVSIPQTIRIDTPALPARAVVARALHLLAHAQRPVILAGEGAWQAGAADELRRFVQATRIPVFADYQGLGLLPAEDPLYAGSFYKLLELQEPTARPDVVLALGVRFGVFTLGANRLIPADAQVIHVESSPVEIGRVRDVTVPLVADSRETLREFNAICGTQSWPDWDAWLELVRGTKAARSVSFEAALARRDPPIHPYQAVAAIVESAGAEAVFVGDGAESSQWLAEVCGRQQPGQFFTHGHMGCLGFGLGFAMGVQRARPGQRVICVTGDGGVGITIAEFDTMARHRLPIVVVVMNNRSWGATKHWQDVVSGPGKSIAVDLGDARYDDVAKAFGCYGAYVTRIEQLRPALEGAFASGRPACVNVEIELAEMPPDSVALMSHA
jgi:acetolactate synthase I/II/III large subunit